MGLGILYYGFRLNFKDILSIMAKINKNLIYGIEKETKDEILFRQEEKYIQAREEIFETIGLDSICQEIIFYYDRLERYGENHWLFDKRFNQSGLDVGGDWSSIYFDWYYDQEQLGHTIDAWDEYTDFIPDHYQLAKKYPKIEMINIDFEMSFTTTWISGDGDCGQFLMGIQVAEAVWHYNGILPLGDLKELLEKTEKERGQFNQFISDHPELARFQPEFIFYGDDLK